jgi:hypothetical protein
VKEPRTWGEVVVPGDPTLCRQYARECTEMAERSVNPDHRQVLANLAQSWLSLAHELERNASALAAAPAAAAMPAARGPEQPDEAIH